MSKLWFIQLQNGVIFVSTISEDDYYLTVIIEPSESTCLTITGIPCLFFTYTKCSSFIHQSQLVCRTIITN